MTPDAPPATQYSDIRPTANHMAKDEDVLRFSLGQQHGSHAGTTVMTPATTNMASVANVAASSTLARRLFDHSSASAFLEKLSATELRTVLRVLRIKGRMQSNMADRRAIAAASRTTKTSTMRSSGHLRTKPTWRLLLPRHQRLERGHPRACRPRYWCPPVAAWVQVAPSHRRPLLQWLLFVARLSVTTTWPAWCTSRPIRAILTPSKRKISPCRTQSLTIRAAAYGTASSVPCSTILTTNLVEPRRWTAFSSWTCEEWTLPASRAVGKQPSCRRATKPGAMTTPRRTRTTPQRQDAGGHFQGIHQRRSSTAVLTLTPLRQPVGGFRASVFAASCPGWGGPAR